MPRPSDLYATSGAAGVYPSSSSLTPFCLPDVFVSPPEDEDDQNIYCLFQGGVCLPNPYQSFDGDSPPVSPTFAHDPFRHDPGSGTRMLRHRTSLYYTTIRDARAGYDIQPTSLDTRTQLEDGYVYPSSDEDGEAVQQSPQGSSNNQGISSRPSSRRSSIFETRPREVLGSEKGEVEKGSSFRTKAVKVLRRLSGASSQTPAEVASVPSARLTRPVEYESWFDMDQRSATQSYAGKVITHLFGANGSKTDVSIPSTSDSLHSQPPGPKLTRRKSVSQLLGLSSKSSTGSSNTESRAQPVSTPSAIPPPKKLSKKNSISRLFGMGRSPPLPPSTDTGGNSYGSPPRLPVPPIEVPSTPVRRHPAPRSRLLGSPSPVSHASTTSPGEDPDSFPPVRSSSCTEPLPNPEPNDIVESQSPTVAVTEKRFSLADSLEAQSDHRHSSSSVIRSSDSITTEDDPQSPIQMDIPAIIVSCEEDSDEIEMLDDDYYDKGSSRSSIELEDDGPFGPEPGDAVHRPMAVDPLPMLDLAVHLNSLSFDKLTFDHDAFEEAIDHST